MSSAARKLPATAAPPPQIDPALRPFVRALAALLVADLERRPPSR